MNFKKRIKEVFCEHNISAISDHAATPFLMSDSVFHNLFSLMLLSDFQFKSFVCKKVEKFKLDIILVEHNVILHIETTWHTWSLIFRVRSYIGTGLCIYNVSETTSLTRFLIYKVRSHIDTRLHIYKERSYIDKRIHYNTFTRWDHILTYN